MIRRRIALLGAVLFGAATTAEAADIYAVDGSYKDIPGAYAPAFSWTGFYLGGHLGYGSGNHGVASDAFDDTKAFDYESHGVFGGGQIGYNLQTGSVVLGVEADIGFLSFEGDDFAPDAFEGERAETEFGAYGVLAARIGFAADRTLFYAKGGLAFADIETTAGDIDIDQFNPNFTTNLDERLYGYAIGGGIEHALSPNWTIKAEYLYLNFDDELSDVGGGPGEATHDTDLHTVKIGVNYLVGGY
jgi:outer membrane immunogenic protein